MTLTAERPRTRRAKPCVRCGQAERAGDTYLCGECHLVAAPEIAAARTADPVHPRHYLMTHPVAALDGKPWRGGWGRNDAAGQPA